MRLFLSLGYPQRKRRGGTVNSRQAQKRTREAASTPEMALEAEPIELVESGKMARDAVTGGGVGGCWWGTVCVGEYSTAASQLWGLVGATPPVRASAAPSEMGCS